MKKTGWKNPKSEQQWKNTLSDYVYPYFGDKPVSEVETSDVLVSLKPIWKSKTETASRVRQRIEAVLNWASANEHRHTENVARWRGHLEYLLDAPENIKTVEHFISMPYTEINKFCIFLLEKQTISSKCLLFIILTASRSGEARLAKWSEISFDEAKWVIPASRMKTNKEHAVPLPQIAVNILNTIKKASNADYIFHTPGKSHTLVAMLYARSFERGDLMLIFMGFVQLFAHGLPT